MPRMASRSRWIDRRPRTHDAVERCDPRICIEATWPVHHTGRLQRFALLLQRRDIRLRRAIFPYAQRFPAGEAFGFGKSAMRRRVFVDDRGAVVDFSTLDRFGIDPASPENGMVRTRWTTPLTGWTEVAGRPRPIEGSAVWHFPSGDLCYAEFSPKDAAIEFNVPPGPAFQVDGTTAW